jgi:hypothetical protein
VDPATSESDILRGRRKETNVFEALTNDLLDLVATELGQSDLYAQEDGGGCSSACCCLCSCCCACGGGS